MKRQRHDSHMTFSGATKESSTCFSTCSSAPQLASLRLTLLIPPCPSLAGYHRLLPLLFCHWQNANVLAALCLHPQRAGFAVMAFSALPVSSMPVVLLASTGVVFSTDSACPCPCHVNASTPNCLT